jgi:hypothetical protein
LLLAGWLRPDPRGWGTHEQLGLPRCLLLALSGMRCPACGMTTAWAHFARGQWFAAVQTHVSGTLLAALALVIAAGAVIVAASGRRLSWQPSEWTLAAALAALAGMVVVEWIVRLVA